MSKDRDIDQLLADAKAEMQKGRRMLARVSRQLLPDEIALAGQRRKRASAARSSIARWWFSCLANRSDKRVAQLKADINNGDGI